MKRLFPSALLALLATTGTPAADKAARNANLVILDESGVKNLRLQTVVAEPGDFEETVFALGVIEPRAGSTAAVSSRIAGRVVGLSAVPGDEIAAGTEIVKVESRQPGSPPPVIGLRAPLDGLVTKVDIRLGDPVEPDRALLEITDLREVFAVARVPEHMASKVKAGTTARITVSALGAQTFEGTLLRFGTAADTTSGTLDAIFRLENPGLLLRPGLRAEFSIVVERRRGVVSVPRSALQGDPAGRFVYVKDFGVPNAFLKTPVVIGQITERAVEIVSGLLPADEVVTQGAYSLAFAGGGTLSLKAALDAAHGHEHNADGSELTPEQKKAKATGKSTAAGDDHGHSHGAEDHEHSPFWMIVSAVLFVLLIAVGFMKRPRESGADTPAAPSTRS